MSSSSRDRSGLAEAWLLASIARARAEPDGQGVTLTAVLITAEGINHAMPTRDETELAIRRLLGAGLVTVDDTADQPRFQVTETGRRLLRRWRGGLFGWIDALPPALRRHGIEEPADWSLPPGTFEHANEQARLAYRKLDEQRRPPRGGRRRR